MKRYLLPVLVLGSTLSFAAYDEIVTSYDCEINRVLKSVGRKILTVGPINQVTPVKYEVTGAYSSLPFIFHHLASGKTQ